MKYYKIKITSPVTQEELHSKRYDELKNKVLKAIYPNISETSNNLDESQEAIIEQVKRQRQSYLRYSEEYGFHLVGVNAANTFPEDALDDPRLKEYLRDKEYELIETDDKYRFLRYRKE